MARTAQALVEPAVLQWGRESLGLAVDDAAAKINVAATRIRQWESGEASPTIAQLRKMAAAYKRPLAVFFLDQPPKTFDAMRDFRRLHEGVSRSWSPQLHSEFRRAQDQREVFLELLSRAGEEPAFTWKPTGAIDDDPEFVGLEMRARLKVTLAEQRSWNQPRQALNKWISLLEEAGILVIQVDRVELDEMRAFSIYGEEAPVIAINGKDYPRPKIFSLMHEYAHLITHSSGLCDELDDRFPGSNERRIEVFCNAAAAAALMPRDSFLEFPEVNRAPKHFEEWTEDSIGKVANFFGVSREAAVRRLLTFAKTTYSFYEAKRREYRVAFEAEKAKQKAEQKPVIVPYPRLQVRNLGKGYVRQVLDAYYQELVSVSEVTDYLRAKASKIEKFAAEARLGGVID